VFSRAWVSAVWRTSPHGGVRVAELLLLAPGQHRLARRSASGPENATSYPHPGELALYPGGQSETELLFPYGYCSFASKAGPLWANHFATLVEGAEQLPSLGRLTLWEGAQQISFREI